MRRQASTVRIAQSLFFTALGLRFGGATEKICVLSMQTQDASSDTMLKVLEWYDANKKLLLGGLVAAGLVVAGVSWYSAQREANELQAGEALTKLMFSQQPNASVPQLAAEFAQVAAKYPGTVAARRAQLQAASALFTAGQYAEAQAQFQKFLADNPSADALTASAQLGVAVCLESQNKPAALAAYQKVAAGYVGTTSAEIAQQAVTRLTPAAASAPKPAPAKS
jgi:predicted negative regulator of RcsB-dependent stress response